LVETNNLHLAQLKAKTKCATKGYTPGCAIKKRWALSLRVDILGIHIATNHPSPTTQQVFKFQNPIGSIRGWGTKKGKTT
jgi:thiamine monophosphate synthase